MKTFWLEKSIQNRPGLEGSNSELAVKNENFREIKFGLSENHTKFEKISSSWFGRLLSKCTNHEEEFSKFCVLLKKSEL